jgi:hypothetical protein
MTGRWFHTMTSGSPRKPNYEITLDDNYKFAVTEHQGWRARLLARDLPWWAAKMLVRDRKRLRL